MPIAHELVAFPELSVRMIDFKDLKPERRMWIPQPERIVARSENHELPDSPGDCHSQCILGKPASGCDVKSHPALARLGGVPVGDRLRFFPENAAGEWVGENDPADRESGGPLDVPLLHVQSGWAVCRACKKFTMP